MKVNSDKFHLIVFARQSTEHSLTFNMGESVIENQPVGKLLSLYVDSVASRALVCRPGRCRRSRRASLSCLGGFRWLVAPYPTARPSPRSVIFWTTSVEPVPLSGSLHGFPYF